MKVKILQQIKNHCLIAFFSFMAMNSLFAQLECKIQLNADGETYEVYVQPDNTITPSSATITGTGQLTIVAPTGFQYADFTSQSGLWVANSTVVSPPENPGFDYISIGLSFDNPPIIYQPGAETLLFTFKRTTLCTGPITLINNDTDPFALLPNSAGTNPGNDLGVFDIGNGLANYFYSKNYGGIAADCTDSDGDGIINSIEDANGNGIFDNGETDFNNPDTDGDGLDDGTEDANQNGILDPAETDPREFCDPDETQASCDFDNDGLNNDVDPDDDNDGVIDAEDVDDFNPNSDSDGDGITDNDETGDDGSFDPPGDSDPLDPCDPNPTSLACVGADADLDGYFADLPSNDPLFDPDDTKPCVPDVSVSNCDFDEDGLINQDDLDDDNDGVADINDVDAYNPNSDSDYDGITDNIETGDDAVYDAGIDTNPLNEDTDSDLIIDGVEDANQNGDLDGGETNPLDPDSDDDNLLDGEEDTNYNGILDGGESDPLDNCDPDAIFPACDFDNDGTPNNLDDDDDNDGVDDDNDINDYNPNSDSDGDGITDDDETGNDGNYDPNSDSDPLNPCDPNPNVAACIEEDNDGDLFYGNYPINHNSYDPDDDDPCVPNSAAALCDFDGDGEINATDPDDDGDGVMDNLDIDAYNPNSDSDGDGITDNIETGEDGSYDLNIDTDPLENDTDNDLISDGVEDANQNGNLDSGETDPLNPDTDGDLLTDGTEDSNLNGLLDIGESDPLEFCDPNVSFSSCDPDDDNILNDVDLDDDGDGVLDSLDINPYDPNSDTDGDGITDIIETGGDGSYDVGPDSNPLLIDTDNDGILDGVEDADKDGNVDSNETDPANPNTDGDDLDDGVEDINHNGQIDPGESNPLDPCDPFANLITCNSTDDDGDGYFADFPIDDPLFDPDDANPCIPNNTVDLCDFDGDGLVNQDDSDDDNDGVNDNSDVDPYNINSDSDGDGIVDNVETGNDASYDIGIDTDPLDNDTDNDLVLDGNEDLNYDGIFDNNETDPRNPNTDGDSLDDGEEDANQNGIVDANESDPKDTCDPYSNFAVCIPIDGDGDGYYFDYPTDDPAFDPDDENPCVPDLTAGTCDFDNDGVINEIDFDDDNDGVADINDVDPYNPNSDSDGDGLTDNEETGGDGTYNPDNDSDPLNPCDPDPTSLACIGGDDDNDGYFANFDPADPQYDPDDTNPCIPDVTVGVCDFDMDGIINGTDTDDDNDGVKDIDDVDPYDPNSDSDFDNITDNIETGEDGQYHSGTDTNPLDSDTDDDLIPDGIEDANQDGNFDVDETDPLNPNTDGDELDDGEEDANQNGEVDAGESDPTEYCDPNATFATCDWDNDGVINNLDPDDDGDGVNDNEDIENFNPNSDSDGDGIADITETLDASDPLDPCDPNPLHPVCTGNTDDLDLDGYSSIVAVDDPLYDPDDNNACIPDHTNGYCDFDEDTIINSLDPDDDNDGVEDGEDVDPYDKESDSDYDGITDNTETGNDGSYDPGQDTDPLNADTDDDSLEDGFEDANQNGVLDLGESDPLNPDDDDDGILTINEDTNQNDDLTDDDTDGDGILDYLDSDPFVFVNINAFLQGAYEQNNGLMQDSLRAKGLIPVVEPYTDLEPTPTNFPFVHVGGGGGESVNTAVFTVEGTDAIVDWVFLELRNQNDPTQVYATRSALIQRDGDIVDVDGVSPVTFLTKEDNYFVVVRHRNHLGVMTAAPIALTRDLLNPMKVDFTNPNTVTYGTNAQRVLGNTTVLWGGNADSNGYIVYQGSGVANPDRDHIFFEIFLDPANTSSSFNHIRNGYYTGDTNMDGSVKYQGLNNDIDVLIFFNVLNHPENTSFFINFFITEQLP